MANTKTQPELRFAGFTEDWEEYSLNEISDLLTGHPFSSKSFQREGILLIRGMNVKRGHLDLSKSVAEYWHTSKGLETFLLQEGDIVIQMDGALIGKSYTKIESKHLPALLVQRVTRLRTDIQTREIVYQFIQRDFLRYINSIKTETAVPHLSLNDIKDFKIGIPRDLNERHKIGNFLSNLDQLITEHQQKHTKLKSLKQAMLDKMFPKQGQTVPEIRFKGFKGEWEEKKLSELSNYSNGKGYESFQSPSGKYELINLNSISIDGGLKPSGKFIEHADTTLKQNDLVMVLSDVGHGDLLGRVALIPEDDKYVLNQRVALLRPNKEILPYFLYYNINANQLYFKTQGAGMSQLNLSKKSVEDFTSLIPKEIDEQIAIADYFKNIDNLITNHETQITKLQNIKKAFLAKMFI